MSNSIALAKFSSLLDSAGVMVNDTAITSVVDSAYVALRSPAGSGGLANLIEDTTPQLGGALDTNNNRIEDASGQFIAIGNIGGNSPHTLAIAGGSTAGNTGQLRIHGQSSSNVTLRYPNSVDATWNLPAGNGSNNQVLTTDGSGNLSWSTPSTGTTNSKTIAYNIFFGG